MSDAYSAPFAAAQSCKRRSADAENRILLKERIGHFMSKAVRNKEKKDTGTVFIPCRGRNDTERYVAINGRRMLVKCGEAVEVPSDFAEIINQSLEQERKSDEFIASNRMSD